jgi:hypothetical protein
MSYLAEQRSADTALAVASLADAADEIGALSLFAF